MNKSIKQILNGGIVFLIGGLLGAFGGASGGSKAIRRFGIPVILAIVAFLKIKHLAVLSIFGMIGCLHLGYGIPDPTDVGSALGRFWYNIFNQNHLMADIFTRGVIGALVALTYITVPLIQQSKGHNIWAQYIVCSIGMILINALLSWKDFGTFELFGRTLLMSEFITWGGISLCAYLIISA